MGNSVSKAAKTAAEASKRQYPTRIPPLPASKVASPVTQAAQIQPSIEGNSEKKVEKQATGYNKHAINRETFDPQFGAALRSLGPVQPSPTQSNSSTVQSQLIHNNDLGGDQPIFPDPKNNPALIVLEARRRFGQEAEAEVEQYGRKGFKGRRFLDVTVIRQILVMRDAQGKSDIEIEEALELYPGVVSKLSREVFSTPSAAGSDNQGVRR